MRKFAVISIGILILLYFLSCGLFRQTHIENWEKDGEDYVIFPANGTLLYYFFRPASYLDGKLTGMNFHIGQHR